MRRFTIFAKGNLDVRDTLHVLRVGGEARWNGINEILRERRPPLVAQVRHETMSRSDALLASTGRIPDALAARELPLGAYPLAAQFSRTLFEIDADAYVLSVQPDIMANLVRDRDDGSLFLAYGADAWPEDDRRWLESRFDPLPMLEPEASIENVGAIVGRLRERTDAPILVYNVSAVVPGDTAHTMLGLGETLATRIRRFNAALPGLSARTGVSIVDVDAVVARAGADRLKLDAFHLNAEGCRRVAAEVARILDDLGILAEVTGQP